MREHFTNEHACPSFYKSVPGSLWTAIPEISVSNIRKEHVKAHDV